MPSIAAIFGICLIFIVGPAEASCLGEVRKFAVDICGEIERSGTRIVVDAKGKLDANVGRIVRRVVGGGSVEADGNVLIEKYSNVLQDQLGAELFNVRDCRVKMVAVAVNQICKPSTDEPPVYPGKNCAYGVPGFQYYCDTNSAGYVVSIARSRLSTMRNRSTSVPRIAATEATACRSTST